MPPTARAADGSDLAGECGHLNWPRLGGSSSRILAPPEWWWRPVVGRRVVTNSGPTLDRIFVLILPTRRSGSGAVTSGAVRADQEGPPGRGGLDPGTGR